MSAAGWTGREMLVVAASRMIRPDDTVVVGLGLPQLAAVLAQRTHAAGVRLLLEIGVFDPEVRKPAMGIADPAMWEGATAFGSMLDVLGGMVHSGRVTLGMLGALQVDSEGSINTTLTREPGEEPRRFNGSGGANDIASMAGRVVVLVEHQPRKFRQMVDFLTSPGMWVRGRPRAEVGLAGVGTTAVVTDRAVFEIGPEGLVLSRIYPGETPEAILKETPISVRVATTGIANELAPPDETLKLLRDELDPYGWYTRRG